MKILHAPSAWSLSWQTLTMKQIIGSFGYIHSVTCMYAYYTSIIKRQQSKSYGHYDKCSAIYLCLVILYRDIFQVMILNHHDIGIPTYYEL